MCRCDDLSVDVTRDATLLDEVALSSRFQRKLLRQTAPGQEGSSVYLGRLAIVIEIIEIDRNRPIARRGQCQCRGIFSGIRCRNRWNLDFALTGRSGADPVVPMIQWPMIAAHPTHNEYKSLCPGHDEVLRHFRCGQNGWASSV